MQQGPLLLGRLATSVNAAVDAAAEGANFVLLQVSRLCAAAAAAAGDSTLTQAQAASYKETVVQQHNLQEQSQMHSAVLCLLSGHKKTAAYIQSGMHVSAPSQALPLATINQFACTPCLFAAGRRWQLAHTLGPSLSTQQPAQRQRHPCHRSSKQQQQWRRRRQPDCSSTGPVGTSRRLLLAAGSARAGGSSSRRGPSN